MSVLMNPDCLDGKHRACSGDGWCEEADHAVPCPCSCHRLDVPPSEVYRAAPGTLGEMLGYLPPIPADQLSTHSANLMATRDDPPRADGQHYDGCPCAACVTIRAARPQPTPPIGTYLCCGVTMRLTPIPGGWTGQTTHLDHCPERGFLLPEIKETP